MLSVLILFAIVQAILTTVFVMLFLSWRKEAKNILKDAAASADKSITTVKTIADAHNSLIQQVESVTREISEMKTSLAFLRGKR